MDMPNLQLQLQLKAVAFDLARAGQGGLPGDGSKRAGRGGHGDLLGRRAGWRRRAPPLNDIKRYSSTQLLPIDIQHLGKFIAHGVWGQ